MTTKRFTIEFDSENYPHILDNNVDVGQYKLCSLLNQFDEKYNNFLLKYNGLRCEYDWLKEETEELKSELIECKSLIMMLADTTISGRIDNIIFSRYNFNSEEEYYNKLDEYKYKVKELFK